ncbi:hypothetical protein [Desulfovibrio sp.]|uniref:hypothetical protein n=1 Tax=Desulfovibrio sp. TaxID=885 RepID=UPI00307770B2
MAGQSLTTQYLSGVDIRGLVLADIAASLLLVLVCGTRFLRIVSLLQGLLSLFCLSYAASMGMPPTLAAILNGSRQIAGMDLRSLWTYIDPAALVALSLLVAIQCWLCGHKPRYRHRWLAIIPACALLATQYNACLLQPPRHFTPEFILGEGRSRFEPPARRSLKYRGYLGTFLMELGSGTAFTPPYVPARTCSSAWTDQIPVPAAPSQLALVQVESLDFELLEMDVDGRPVMPFLRSLLPDAILLRLDGTKKLASANSDFELFNGLEASPDFVHYEYEYAYPRSLIAQLGSGGSCGSFSWSARQLHESQGRVQAAGLLALPRYRSHACCGRQASGLLVGRRRHGQGSFRLCSPADAFRSFRPIHHHHEYASAGVCGPHRS